MLKSKEQTIQDLLFILKTYNKQETFFGTQADWRQQEQTAIYTAMKTQIGQESQNFLFNKTVLDISAVWASNTLVENMVVYIKSQENAQGDWALLGVLANYDYTIKDKGATLGLFYKDTIYTNLASDKVLIEGISSVGVLSHLVYNLGNEETLFSKPLSIPTLTQASYKVTKDDDEYGYANTYMTQDQVIQEYPYIKDYFTQMQSTEDEIDIKFTLFNPKRSVHIVRI